MKIIISSKPGQLGNSLFLFSHFIAFAIEKNHTIINPTFIEYSDYFDSTGNKILFSRRISGNNFLVTVLGNKYSYKIAYYCGRIINRLKIDNRFVKCIYLDWHEGVNLCHAEKLFKSKLIFVQGWNFRCAEYLNRHYNEVKNFFTPQKQYSDKIDNLISNARQKCDLLIGVHIRHGDYKKFQRGRFFFEIEQYKEIMLKITGLFPGKKILFLVCTNSKEDISVLNDVNIVRGTNHEFEDMYVLAKCDYLIGPPSTYTMWASFYGQVPLYQIHDLGHAITLEDFKVLRDG